MSRQRSIKRARKRSNEEYKPCLADRIGSWITKFLKGDK